MEAFKDPQVAPLVVNPVQGQPDPCRQAGRGHDADNGACTRMSCRSQVMTFSVAMLDQMSRVPPRAVPISSMILGASACTARASAVISDGICRVLTAR